MRRHELSIVKDYRFPVAVRFVADGRTIATVPEKPELEVATPPEFKGGIRGVWSPEDLLVTAAATCYAVTFAAVAERRGIAVRDLVVTAAGHVTRRDDARFGFVAIELDVKLETDEEHVEAAERAARRAKEICLVTTALDVPVHLGVDVRASKLEGVV